MEDSYQQDSYPLILPDKILRARYKVGIFCPGRPWISGLMEHAPAVIGLMLYAAQVSMHSGKLGFRITLCGAQVRYDRLNCSRT